jgi:hypothetical protein
MEEGHSNTEGKAMIATLTRGASTDQGTFGVLKFGTSVIRTVELPWRNNARQRSCIPPGVYRCSIVNSPRFGRVYGVANVPGRTHVLIHSANFAGDVDLGWTSQLHGCIAPCQRVGAMRNSGGKMQAAGLLSRPALNSLMAWAAGQPFNLEIA